LFNEFLKTSFDRIVIFVKARKPGVKILILLAMQTSLLDIEGELSQHFVGRTNLSFRRFVEYLKHRIETEQSVRTKFYRFALKKFEMHPEVTSIIKPEETEKYSELFELVYASLLPLTFDENSNLWGLSVPLMPKIFYGTNALYELLVDKQTGKPRSAAVIPMEEQGMRKHRIEMIYALLLERLYNIPSTIKFEMIHSFFDSGINLQKYYKVDIDARFIDIKLKTQLPELNPEKLQYYLNSGNAIDFCKEKLPLSSFMFEGFSVLTMTDITDEYAIESIKDSILNRRAHDDKFYYNRVIQSLKTLCSSNVIEFGLLPMLRINNKLVFNDETCLHSILTEKVKTHGIAESTYLTTAEKYAENPRLILYRTITEEDEQRQIFLKILKQTGIRSYAMLPVFYNNSLAGMLEVYSKEENLLDEKIIAKLETVMPLLSQLMQNSIDEFDTKIDNIIKDKFTSLQPGVYWKFNEAAWHFLKDSYSKTDKTEIETVRFENVYPLYGAIDIRNSTAQRNEAMHADLKIQFELLVQTLKALKRQFNFGLIDEKIFECREWINSISRYLTANDEMSLNTFLTQDIDPFLLHLKKNYPSAGDLINTYFDAIDPVTGAASENKRALENSMQAINAAINNRLDQFKDELQKSYPCYFEKFRTDGIEYDIYIGQSITPEISFDLLYLNNLRLWQMTSMADIAKLTNSLLPQLPKPLHITQLIFVHGNTIDISFRNDERRFDVEGTYNIGYEVIKKRIDKVLIRNTNERLTQPGKIALVYFNRADADEYVKYIYYLQEQNILNDDLEQLDLEELQGVSGLKALRVGVNLD